MQNSPSHLRGLWIASEQPENSQEGGNVVTISLDACSLLDGCGFGLMERLRQHRRETEYFAMAGQVQKNDLIVFVNFLP
jgi:hypothetical protein